MGCSVIKAFFTKLFGGTQEGPCASQKSCCGEVCNLAEKINLTEEDQTILKNIDEKIVVGKILEISAHPDPKVTKVRVTKCDIGNGGVEQILCGGTNIEEGLIVPVAMVGAKLSEDFQIGERDIRGQVSRGMICARMELGISRAGEEKGQIWPFPPEVEQFLGKSLKTLI